MVGPVRAAARCPKRQMLVFRAVIVRQMDVEELVAESFQVLIPAVVMPLDLRVAAVQVKAKEWNLLHDRHTVFQLILPSVWGMFHHDCHAEIGSFLTKRR